MAALSRDAILAAHDLRMEEVAVPEWSGSVWIRSLSGIERDDFEADYLRRKGYGEELQNFRARLVMLCACDESGNRLFTADDLEPLGKKSAAALDRLFAAAQQLNGIGGRDMEELQKNS